MLLSFMTAGHHLDMLRDILVRITVDRRTSAAQSTLSQILHASSRSNTRTERGAAPPCATWVLRVS